MEYLDDPNKKSLTNTGVQAVGFLAGGALFLGLGALPAFLGVIAGGVAAVLGLGSLFSKDKTDSRGGLVVAGAGILTLVSRLGVFPPIKALGAGIWKGINFLSGLRALKK
jgi:hypothetical protein